jgi:hypothetical protein
MTQNGHGPLSRAEAIRAARAAAAANREHVFPLTATGGEALVRRLDLMDLIALDAIPAHLTEVVNQMLAETLGGEGEPTNAALFAALGGPLNAVKHQRELADAACCAGFIDPQVVPTPDAVTDPARQIAVTEIERADRDAYWSWAMGAEEAQAAALAGAFPQPGAAPSPRPAGESLRGEPVRLVDAAFD